MPKPTNTGHAAVIVTVQADGQRPAADHLTRRQYLQSEYGLSDVQIRRYIRLCSRNCLYFRQEHIPHAELSDFCFEMLQRVIANKHKGFAHLGRELRIYTKHRKTQEKSHAI